MSEGIWIAIIGVFGMIVAGGLGAWSQAKAHRDEREAQQDKIRIERLRALAQRLRLEVEARQTAENVAAERIARAEGIPFQTAKIEVRSAAKQMSGKAIRITPSSKYLTLSLDEFERGAISLTGQNEMGGDENSEERAFSDTGQLPPK
jgi:hypothetical protein